MDSSIDMDSSQTRSNGDESRAGAEELRKSYHHLSNSLAECSIDPNNALEQATEMLEKVQRPQEAYLDSKIVFNCVRKIKEKADTRRGNRSIFKTKDFAGFLKHSKYEDSSAGKIDWKMLGRRMQHAVNRPAPLEYIYGSFEREESRPDQNTSGPAKQKRKSFVKSNEPVQATRYTVHNAASKDKDQAPKGPDVTELSKIVEKTLRKLCRNSEDGGICLYTFVLHPTSFSETVRHLFLSSFLVKEKKAAIIMKEPNKPRLYYGKSGGQCVFTLTKNQWEQLVELLEIIEPKIQLPEIATTSKE